jgi:hypothetical protein
MTRTRGGWVARDDHIRSGIAYYYGARSTNGIRPHRHSGADKDPSGNPTSFLNHNRFRNKVEGWLFKIVRTGAKKRPLGQAHIGGDGDAVECEYQNLLADPDMVPDLQAKTAMETNSQKTTSELTTKAPPPKLARLGKIPDF